MGYPVDLCWINMYVPQYVTSMHTVIPPHFISCFSLCVMCKWIKHYQTTLFICHWCAISRSTAALAPPTSAIGQPFNLPGPFRVWSVPIASSRTQSQIHHWGPSFDDGSQWGISK